MRQGRALIAWLLLVIATSGQAEPAALKSYLDLALQTHPELQAADATVEAARAKAVSLSRPLYNPEIDAEGQRGQTEAYAVGVSQTLDLSGKRSARTASGEILLNQAIAEREALRQRIATDILQAVAALQARRITASLAEQRTTLLQSFADVAEQQFRAGDIGELDRDLALLAHAESIALNGRAELDLLKAQQILDAATRNPALQAPALPNALPDAASQHDGNPSNYERLAETLPAVRAALAKRDAAVAEIQVARSQARPDPTVSLRAGREQDRDGGNRELLAGIQISIPLLIRNTYRADTQAASAEASSARIDAEAAYRLALQQMSATSSQYARAYAAWQRWHALSTARIDTDVELLDRVWRVREITTAEYVLQLKQLLDGRAAGEELRLQAWQAWFEWLSASGQSQSWLMQSSPASVSE